MRMPGKRVAAACMAFALLGSGCAGAGDEPKVYLAKNEPEVVISLFAQGEDISKVIGDCCADVINPRYNSNLIVYSDYADFYADKGLSPCA